jgi:hypothetical protein
MLNSKIYFSGIILEAYFAILCMCFLIPYFLLRKGNLWIVFVFQFIEISFLPAYFETPLEEFEIQLMDTDSILSPDNLDTRSNITFRKEKKQNITYDDECELLENQSKETVKFGSQTEALPIHL